MENTTTHNSAGYYRDVALKDLKDNKTIEYIFKLIEEEALKGKFVLDYIFPEDTTSNITQILLYLQNKGFEARRFNNTSSISLIIQW